MAKQSCCGQSTCSCLIQAGDGVLVTGSGSSADPYEIALDMSVFSPTLQVDDTATVDLTLSGQGLPSNPYRLRADATMSVSALTDVDESVSPVQGQVLIFDQASQHWKPGLPPSNPAGSINVTNGLSGTGAAATPVAIATSGTWGSGPLAGLGSDSTIGLVIYVDSNGQIRTQPVSAAWADITGKPSTFPPSPHTHVAADITDPQNLMVGGIAATQAAGGAGVAGPFVWRVGTTEDTTWPNGTIWAQPQL